MGIKIKKLIYLILFLILIKFSLAVRINEVMYDPIGSDNNKEFVEIFSKSINFTNYIISDGDSNDTLILFYFNNNSNYSLIVEDDFLIETNNASVYKIGATIGNGLSFDDIIYFYYPNETLIDSVEINSSIANGNDYSMSYYNGSWIESQQINGTPGYENILTLNITNQTQNETSQNYTSLRISEIMYNPYDSVQCPDANCEWIELYNNGSELIELNGLMIDDNIFEDVVILPNEYIIVARELIDLNGGDSFEAYWGNNDSIWDSNDGDYKAVDGYFSLTNNGGDTITLKANDGQIIESLTYSNGRGADGDGNSLQLINGTWYASTPTPGYENFFNGTQEEPEEDEDLTFKISINKEQFEIGDELIINGNFTNTYNFSIDGNLIIKIGKEKIGGGFEYPEDYILINQDITLNNGITILNDLFGEVKWIIPTVFTGKYKVYAPFSSETKNRRPSKIFNIRGLGNIFIDSWHISNYNLDLENNTSNISINITNNETNPYSINLSIIIEDLKTVNKGKHDFEYFCENFTISNSTTITKNCNFILPDDTITNGTLKFDIYPKITFVYENTMLLKKSEEKEINITGLEDLGEPTLEILSNNLTTKFGDFTSVFVKYNTNNYNFPLRFIAYAYTPKRISMDLNTDTIYKKFCEVNTAIELQNLERGKTIYLSLPIFIKKNCDNDYENRIYESFARVCEFKNEWSYMSPTNDFKKKFNLIISGNNNANCPITKYKSGGGSGEKTTKTSKPFYEIISIPKEVNLNQEFSSKIRLNNNDKTNNKYSVWSYVYRGSKCYSGEREQNIQELTIPTKSSAVIELKNIALEKGDFKFKIKIKKNEQKSTKDITQSINIASLEKEKIEEFKEEKTTLKSTKDKFLSEKPETIYLSSSAKARNLVSSFILSLLAFLSISFIWKKTI